jgi:glycolate oxidase
VPVPLLPELLAGIAAIADRNDTQVPVVAHAGDGNTHPLVVYDPTDEEALARGYAAFDEIMALAISLGGTITGEHGVGRNKKAALPQQLGPEVMALTRTIKNALDPQGILNPGAVM